LIRLLLTESLVLAILGGVAGLVLAVVLPPILFSVIPEIGLDIDFKPNATVFAYMFVISLITGVVFGLAPALQSTKPDLTAALKSTRSGPRISRPHLRNLLVIGQVAVSLVLLIGAGLLVRGLQQAQSTPSPRLVFTACCRIPSSSGPARSGFGWHSAPSAVTFSC
jgi:hypothetical protein